MSANVPAALITGASRGIGLGVAHLLATKGYALTISSRDAAALDAVRAELLDAGAAEVIAVVADMADEDAVFALGERHVATFGRLNALVLAAGVGTAAGLGDTTPNRWDKQFAVNVRSAFLLVSTLLPTLRTTGADSASGARVIALSSIGGVYAEPGLGAYGASKAALVSLCRSLNVEESGNRVTATAICPAYVDTDLSAWVHDTVPPESMITVADIVGLIEAVLAMSASAVVTELVVSRAGTSGHVA